MVLPPAAGAAGFAGAEVAGAEDAPDAPPISLAFTFAVISRGAEPLLGLSILISPALPQP